MKQNKKMRVLVLGGRGFIGRQVVRYLAHGADVVVGTRSQTQEKGRLTIRMQKMLSPKDWEHVIKRFDVVVNSVGILRERKNETYKQVHTLAVEALATACARMGVSLIQVSALGLSSQAKSRFIQSKLAGEKAILSSGAKATIVRPSLLDGEGGYGAKWFRRVAAWPVHFVMPSDGLVAPLQVTDLGEAIAKLVYQPASQRPVVAELGGEIYSIPQYLAALRKVNTPFRAWQIPVPKLVVRLFSHVFDVLNWTPLSFGHYELMQGYNVPEKDLLPILLERQPTLIGEQSCSPEQTVNICT